MSAAEGWNDTEVPVNISVVPEDVNVSEDLLEDDNESTELDGNLSDAKLASVSLLTKCYPRKHRVDSTGLRREAFCEGMVSEGYDDKLLRECIRQSRTEENVSEVSNRSGLDHSGPRKPGGLFMRCSQLSTCKATTPGFHQRLGLQLTRF